MKRHPSLRDLSVDHHHTLVQAQHLQSVTDDDERTRHGIAVEFFHFWREHANPHFREEEEALLPFFARFGDVGAEPIRQMQIQHILIRREVALLHAASVPTVSTPLTPEAAVLRALGAQLETHVRLEERVVFPIIEETLPAEMLTELAGVLAGWRAEAHTANTLPRAETFLAS
jgi:iron-sulfur cluster repair protein YtfE (RIC family)